MRFPVVLAVLVAIGLWSETSRATPTYAIRAGHACDTCHIEPIGWADPPEIKERRCTLDCRACHKSPSGGGLRKPMGKFYAAERLATFGSRPSESVNPNKYRNRGTRSTEGTYSLWDGFSGWDRGGTTPYSEIQDRFGDDIEADPGYQIGFDLRMLALFPSDGDRAIFPMQAEIYGSVEPTDSFSLYVAGGLQGRRTRTVEDFDTKQQFEDYFTVRELFAMWDDLDWNSYVRVGRFTKPYGWRIPDHTALVRRDLGQDQFAQVFGIEGSINPNYPWATLAAFYQGWDPWPGDQQTEAAGAALTLGVRELGWQAGLSTEFLHLLDGSRVDQFTIGPHWGVNLYPFTYKGEVNVRARGREGDKGIDAGLFVFHEVNYQPVRGVSLMAQYNWADPNVRFRGDHRARWVFGADWWIQKNTQLGVQYRFNSQGGNRGSRDALIQAHVFY